MGNVDVSDKNSIILGRPFLKTSRTKIDVFAGTLSIEFDEEVINFKTNNDDFPPKNISVNYMGTKSPLSEGWCEFSNVSVQGKFADRNLSSIVEELVEDKLGEVNGEYLIPAVDESEKKLKRKMPLEE